MAEKNSLWKNIRNKGEQNRRTGATPKKPTTEMIRQERKIKAKQYAEAGPVGEDEDTRPVKHVKSADDPAYKNYVIQKRLAEFSNLPHSHQNYLMQQNNFKNALNDNNLVSLSDSAWNNFMNPTLDSNSYMFGEPAFTDPTTGDYGSEIFYQDARFRPTSRNTPGYDYVDYPYANPNDRSARWTDPSNPNLSYNVPAFLQSHPPSRYHNKTNYSGLTGADFTYRQEGPNIRYIKPKTPQLENITNLAELQKIYPGLTQQELDAEVLDRQTNPFYLTNRLNANNQNILDYSSDYPTNRQNDIDYLARRGSYYPDTISNSYSTNMYTIPEWDEPSEHVVVDPEIEELKRRGITNIPIQEDPVKMQEVKLPRFKPYERKTVMFNQYRNPTWGVNPDDPGQEYNTGDKTGWHPYPKGEYINKYNSNGEIIEEKYPSYLDYLKANSDEYDIQGEYKEGGPVGEDEKLPTYNYANKEGVIGGPTKLKDGTTRVPVGEDGLPLVNMREFEVVGYEGIDKDTDKLLKHWASHNSLYDQDFDNPGVAEAIKDRHHRIRSLYKASGNPKLNPMFPAPKYMAERSYDYLYPDGTSKKDSIVNAYTQKYENDKSYKDRSYDLHNLFDKAALAIKSLTSANRYSPLSNKVSYVSTHDVDDDYKADKLVAELSHAYQQNKLGKSVSKSWLKEMINNPTFNSKSYQKKYKDPTSFEYEAHSVIQPRMQEYIDGKISLEELHATFDKKAEGGYYPTQGPGKALFKGYAEGGYTNPYNQYQDDPYLQYANGGYMYGKGGRTWKDIGAGAFGVLEGVVDTTFGWIPGVDMATDMAYKGLQKLGKSSADEIREQDSIHGYGQTVGAVGSAILTSGATTANAISEGAQGLGQGISKGSETSDAARGIGTGLNIAGSIVGTAYGSTDSAKAAKEGFKLSQAGSEGLGKFAAAAPKSADAIRMAQTAKAASNLDSAGNVIGNAAEAGTTKGIDAAGNAISMAPPKSIGVLAPPPMPATPSVSSLAPNLQTATANVPTSLPGTSDYNNLGKIGDVTSSVSSLPKSQEPPAMAPPVSVPAPPATPPQVDYGQFAVTPANINTGLDAPNYDFSYNPSLPTYSQGGNITNNSLNLRNTMRYKRFAKGGTFDQYGINYIPESSGLHHENAYGGVPIGPDALAEGGEIKMDTGDGSQYIVSDQVDGAESQKDFTFSKGGKYKELNRTLADGMKQDLNKYTFGSLATSDRVKGDLRRPNDSYGQSTVEQIKNKWQQKTEYARQRSQQEQSIAQAENQKRLAEEEYIAAYGGKINPKKYPGLNYAKGGIHIKPENKGKFTASAKAAGQSVQEHATSVLNNPNATPLQKKRANFAKNAAGWKHANGGYVHNQMTQPMYAGGGPMPSNLPQAFDGPSAQNKNGMYLYPNGGPSVIPTGNPIYTPDSGIEQFAPDASWLDGGNQVAAPGNVVSWPSYPETYGDTEDPEGVSLNMPTNDPRNRNRNGFDFDINFRKLGRGFRDLTRGNFSIGRPTSKGPTQCETSFADGGSIYYDLGGILPPTGTPPPTTEFNFEQNPNYLVTQNRPVLATNTTAQPQPIPRPAAPPENSYVQRPYRKGHGTKYYNLTSSDPEERKKAFLANRANNAMIDIEKNKGIGAQNLLSTFDAVPVNRAEGGMMSPDQQMQQQAPQEQMQQQGGQDQMMQMVQQVEQMLQQGAQPEQVMQQLVQSGVPQEQAQQVVQMAMQDLQSQMQQQGQEQPMQEGQQMPPQQGMARGGMYPDGGMIPTQNGMANKIADDLRNGAEPNQVLQQLVGQGMSQEQAMAMVQAVMGQVSSEMQKQPQQQMAQQPMMAARGGYFNARKQYKKGGEKGGDDDWAPNQDEDEESTGNTFSPLSDESTMSKIAGLGQAVTPALASAFAFNKLSKRKIKPTAMEAVLQNRDAEINALRDEWQSQTAAGLRQQRNMGQTAGSVAGNTRDLILSSLKEGQKPIMDIYSQMSIANQQARQQANLTNKQAADDFAKENESMYQNAMQTGFEAAGQGVKNAASYYADLEDRNLQRWQAMNTSGEDWHWTPKGKAFRNKDGAYYNIDGIEINPTTGNEI